MHDDNDDIRNPAPTTSIRKGWGVLGEGGNQTLTGQIPEVPLPNQNHHSLGTNAELADWRKKNHTGEIYAWHEPSERPAHSFNARTVKILYLDKGKSLSLHFHKNKSEIFACAWGIIEVTTINKEGITLTRELTPGKRIFIPQCMPHKMKGLSDLNILVEVSTIHHDEDSYRIKKGD